MNVVGCDPGAFGAIAILDTETRQLTLIDMPTLKVKRGPRVVNQVDPALLAQALRPHIRENDRAYVEKTWAMTGQGVSSSFAFGRAGGVLEGVLAALGAVVTLVPPATWTKTMRFFKGKDASRERAIELFPEHATMFSRKKDDGRADAALIAVWGLEHGSETRIKTPTKRKIQR